MTRDELIELMARAVYEHDLDLTIIPNWSASGEQVTFQKGASLYAHVIEAGRIK